MLSGWTVPIFIRVMKPRREPMQSRIVAVGHTRGIDMVTQGTRVGTETGHWLNEVR